MPQLEEKFNSWTKSILNQTDGIIQEQVLVDIDLLERNSVYSIETMLYNLTARDPDFISAVCHLIFRKPIKGSVNILGSLLNHDSSIVRSQAIWYCNALNPRRRY